MKQRSSGVQKWYSRLQVVCSYTYVYSYCIQQKTKHPSFVVFNNQTQTQTQNVAATAGVVRAVGGQGTIIGPTHAISAALTSLKGAARRVRRGNGNGNVTGDDGGGEAPGAAGAGLEAEEPSVGGEGAATLPATENSNGAEGWGLGEDAGGGGGAAGGGVRRPEEEWRRPEDDDFAAWGGGWRGSVFGEEAGRYGVVLDAMMRGAVAVRDE